MKNNILNDYERKYNIDIPQSVCFFINSDTGNELLPVYYDKKQDFKFPIVNYLGFSNEIKKELLITELVNIENLESYLRSFEDMVDYQQDFFPISFGVMPYSSWLLVGINKENYLQVWITAPGGGSDLTLLCNNLFLFFNNCKQIFNREINFEKLYKNYDENFWRIKR